MSTEPITEIPVAIKPTSSPLIETTPDKDSSSGTATDVGDRSVYTYILSAIVVGLVVYLLYYSYSCFYENQDLYMEPFIEKTVKSGQDADQSFDMDVKVDELKRKQEKYLDNINSKNNR